MKKVRNSGCNPIAPSRASPLEELLWKVRVEEKVRVSRRRSKQREPQRPFDFSCRCLSGNGFGCNVEHQTHRRNASFFFNRWLHRISRILAVLGYEGVKQATPEVLRPKRKSSAHSL